MSKKATLETFEALHEALAKDLLKRIREGTATAADLNVARAFLKDNGVDAIPAQGSPVGDLVANLPFASTEDTYTKQ
ncbi:hypothetical protein Ga0061061_1178 [Chelatococcus sambhunathii]|uniref:Uncharacterized protein n=1 Tax=Chelatococcus sambhunathii TaxID=363953 RepID=A0ABM9U9I5_9HYPH|nr:hypothetical protein [Chelatococcus sambhunathii]CUA90947.1 hypothetical protein Ga0061061_1178 [Chelatococcus sambhunathii]